MQGHSGSGCVGWLNLKLSVHELDMFVLKVGEGAPLRGEASTKVVGAQGQVAEHVHHMHGRR